MKNHLDITTPIGFYNTYFELLPLYKTRKEAFNYLNEQVKNITSKQPYKNYKEFRNKIAG
ncbi:hypothetical protein DFR65_101364 [Oceanihabitans sediminis]|uniref:Uncharacterized protein n=1 Tax=Oceanihabitans sediminis TaxID=1812012 RepID=A0A368PA91_9FLAO|nr:hypothetical protein [Oceanihabitans sediminis]RBP34471.1 hypothetical protein DFR65_101364 [Oceanihabitans sediminis]RCU58141.1 hypothetical protein DU428_01800 [Oceanihabitans sediminis]